MASPDGTWSRLFRVSRLLRLLQNGVVVATSSSGSHRWCFFSAVLSRLLQANHVAALSSNGAAFVMIPPEDTAFVMIPPEVTAFVTIPLGVTVFAAISSTGIVAAVLFCCLPHKSAGFSRIFFTFAAKLRQEQWGSGE